MPAADACATFPALQFQDLHDGDIKTVSLDANHVLTMGQPGVWNLTTKVDPKTCKATVDFSKSAKPKFPPVPLVASISVATGNDRRPRFMLTYTDPTKTISPSPDFPLNMWESLIPKAAPFRPAAQYDTCNAAVQTNLRYNISTLTSADITVPVAVDPRESLATAICCDNRTQVFAEPRFLFQSPFVDLFKHMNQDGPTIFYDSVCGIPLFKAPMNRSFADFQADTTEHGWPSFRPAEIIDKDSFHTTKDGFVYSKCGTHLGSFLPDDKGDRWCLDTSCLAGNPAK